MASLTLNDYAVTNGWTNLAATLTSAASVDAVFQCVSQDKIQIVAAASGGVPTGKTGLILDTLDSVQLNAAQIWVKNFDGDGATLSVTTL